MLAHNPWNPAFGERVAFADLAGRQTSWTGDRREFIGETARSPMPAALAAARCFRAESARDSTPARALQTPSRSRRTELSRSFSSSARPLCGRGAHR